MIAEEQVSEKLTDLLPEGQGLEQELNSLAHKWVEESLFVLLDSYKGFFKNAQTILYRTMNATLIAPSNGF